MRAADFEAALALVRRCDAAVDIAEFRTSVLEVGSLLGSEDAAYSEIDLVDGTVEGEIRPAWLKDEEWLDAFESRVHEHPVIGYMSETGDIAPRAISDMLSERDFHATGLYREYFARIDVEDQISVGLPSSPRTVLRLALNRRSRGFSSRERALLGLVAPHLGTAYLAARARTAVAGSSDAVIAGDDLVALDAAGIVTVILGRAATLLGDAGAPVAVGEPAPPALIEHRSAQDDETRTGGGAEVRLEGPTGTIAIRTLGGGYPGAARILALIEEREAVEAVRAGELGMTPREAEVANLLARGLSNQEIVARLHLSPHTLKRHLEQVYAKLGVGSRATAVARLLGAGA